MISDRLDRLRTSSQRYLYRATDITGVINLAGGLPTEEAFPVDAIAAAVERLSMSPDGTLQYTPSQGIEQLRQWIAGALSARGGSFGADRVVVTHGSQQALDLLARALVNPGDLVAIDAPTYVGALRSFDLAGASYLTLPRDTDGTDLAVLADRLREGARPVLLYTATNFHNPTGTSYSAERREALITLADRYGFVIIEDDAYGELRYEGDPVPSLAAASDRAVYMGSFSKTIAPGLRIGFAVVPGWLTEPLIRLKQAVDLNTSTWLQAITADVLAQPGVYEHQVARLVTIYRRRRDALVEALDGMFGELLTYTRPTGGFYTWIRLAPDIATADELFEAALRRRVAFARGSDFYTASPDDSAFRLAFSMPSPDRLVEGMKRLRAAVDDVRSA